MKIEIVKVGYLETNCYILSFNNHVLVIDPGADYDRIVKQIGNRIIDGIIITHKHFDHIGALKEFSSIPIYDSDNINDFKNPYFKFIVLKTPGHTKDSITIYFEKEKVMFVGDFIFKDSIGRTDLGGNDLDMQASINLIKKYPKDVIIYPGHGSKTSLGYEIENNYYFRGEL